MRIMFLGDIVGKSGRKAVVETLPLLRQKLDCDMVIANSENAAHGFGITAEIADELLDAGIDVLTGGNHSWDKSEIQSYISGQPRLLRPANQIALPPVAGQGSIVYELADGRRVLVVNVLLQLFMEPVNSPYQCLDGLIPQGSPGDYGLDGVVVDVHGEATSEKYCLGHFCDGRASLVIGTHTHIPTADAHIMEHGTAFQADAGMCGDYDSSIGMNKLAALDRALGRLPKARLTPAEGEASLCGVVVDIDRKTGLAVAIQPLRQGGLLAPALPSLRRG